MEVVGHIEDADDAVGQGLGRQPLGVALDRVGERDDRPDGRRRDRGAGQPIVVRQRLLDRLLLLLFTLAVLLLLAWMIAGYYGLDRVLLPVLGTLWQRVPAIPPTARPQPVAGD